MTSRVHNVRGGLLRRNCRSLALIVYVLAALTGGLGIPVHGLLEAEDKHERAVQGLDRLTELRREMLCFEAAGGFDRLERARQEAVAQIPDELSSAGVRGTMQLLCRASGFELRTLNVGELKAAGFESAYPGLGLREVSISGFGRPMALQRLIERWRGLGYPTRLLHCQLDRDTPERLEFEIAATLGLFQSAPWLDEGTVESAGGEDYPGEDNP